MPAHQTDADTARAAAAANVPAVSSGGSGAQAPRGSKSGVVLQAASATVIAAQCRHTLSVKSCASHWQRQALQAQRAATAWRGKGSKTRTYVASSVRHRYEWGVLPDAWCAMPCSERPCQRACRWTGGVPRARRQQGQGHSHCWAAGVPAARADGGWAARWRLELLHRIHQAGPGGAAAAGHREVRGKRRSHRLRSAGRSRDSCARPATGGPAHAAWAICCDGEQRLWRAGGAAEPSRRQVWAGCAGRRATGDGRRAAMGTGDDG